MKHLITFLVFAFATHFATAQEVDSAGRIIDTNYVVHNNHVIHKNDIKLKTTDSSKAKEKYCLILATGKFLSAKVSIAVDYGQEQRYLSDKRIKDENGKVQTFNSVIDALNYMSSQGWVFVDAYAITIGNQHVYHYLMKQEIK